MFTECFIIFEAKQMGINGVGPGISSWGPTCSWTSRSLIQTDIGLDWFLAPAIAMGRINSLSRLRNRAITSYTQRHQDRLQRIAGVTRWLATQNSGP